MLLASNMPARIAEKVDHQTDTAFRRAFRRESGPPPSAWQRRQAGAIAITPER